MYIFNIRYIVNIRYFKLNEWIEMEGNYVIKIALPSPSQHEIIIF